MANAKNESRFEAPWSTPLSVAAIAVGTLGLVLISPITSAAPTPLTPYAEVNQATLTGSTNVVNLDRVPVVLSNGSVVYSNLTIPLDVTVDAQGVVTIMAGQVTQVKSPTTLANGFQAGTYYGPGSSASNQYIFIQLSGPGVTTGGATEWSLKANGNCAYPASASFYVGPLASNPLYARLKAAGIASSSYSYGVMLGANCSGQNNWETGAIVGFSQTGSAINIVSFSQNGKDYATPIDQITYAQ